ncbi:OmpA family protein [bacterium]|nr:OmpA family protein [bacterium]
MFHLKRKMLFSILLVLSLPLYLHAQYATGQIGFHLSAGAVKLIGGEIDQSIINPLAAFDFSLTLNEHMDIRAGIDMAWVRPRSAHSHFQQRIDAPFRTYLYPWSITLKYRFFEHSLWTPYLTIGAGMTHWNLRDVSGGDKWFPVPQSGESIHGSQMHATALFGMGFSFFLNKTISIGIDGRYGHMLRQILDMSGTGDANNGVISCRIFVGIHFKGKHDRDNDGILDKYDLDPEHAEDIDGFQDSDGKPDYDNDNDGIPDLMDKAPNQPEDIDGFEDEDGAPDLDNDKDGVPDVYDMAPLLAEDVDGFQDNDGVPDLDNDKDGIPDIDDPHPNIHEDKFLIQVEKEEATVTPVLPDIHHPLILKNVRFESGKALLTTEAELALETTAISLKAYPEVQIEIKGYTDSTGDAMKNLHLSQRRAESVMTYLIDNGIAQSRLKAVGYGEAIPIASNETPEGRALNRRIELIRID